MLCLRMNKYTKAAACVVGAGAVYALLRRSGVEASRKSLAGQVVLITGGSRGLGLALAREFGSLGCRVAICARDQDGLDRAKQILTEMNYDVFAIAGDVSDRNSVDNVVRATRHHYGEIDILVNNAGEIMVSPLENLAIEDFERAMAVMFWGMVYMSFAVLPSMKERGAGRIVNITSIGGKVSVPHLLSYSCAKAAAAAFSNGLHHEVRQHGVDVTTVVPGLMRTGSHVNARFKGDRVGESAWFGAAASMPLLSIDAERAARGAVDAMCAGSAEAVLGAPAQILVQLQTLLPNLTAEILRFSNWMLPNATSGDTAQPGRDLENQHGSLYRVLTTLGRRAGQTLNQPVSS
jgi:short-subunit dehydrogenase